MLSPQSPLPWWWHAANLVGPVLRAIKISLGRLDEETVSRAAMSQTGLTDFGDPHYREGLQQVLASAEDDAQLHFLGRVGLQGMITGYLATRLRLTAARKRTPDVFQRPLIPPLIILGVPRSGTTLLHHLLALDPTHRALPLWELLRPVPEGSPDRRRSLIERQLNPWYRLVPELDRKHYSRADSAEECQWLLAPSFVSWAFWVAAPVYGYLDWYCAQDRRRAYQEYYALLQVVQSMDPTRRLTLKAPAHTGALAVLRETIPNAMLIQTHRNPVTVCSSLNSVFVTVHQMVTNHLDVPRMAEANTRLLEHELAQNLAAREVYPDAVLDVYYERLVADPTGTVRGIYDHFGLEWSEAYATRLQAYIREHPQGKYGQHRYAAAEFGQTEAELARRFAAYSTRFGLAAAPM